MTVGIVTSSVMPTAQQVVRLRSFPRILILISSNLSRYNGTGQQNKQSFYCIIRLINNPITTAGAMYRINRAVKVLTSFKPVYH